MAGARRQAPVKQLYTMKQHLIKHNSKQHGDDDEIITSECTG